MKYVRFCINNKHYCLLIVLLLSQFGKLESQADSQHRNLVSLEAAVEEGLSNNPGLLAVRNKYNAARERIPQAKVLPDPKLQITHFFESVQTRTGPQENLIVLSQGIPWPGTLRHREEAVSAEADALWHAYQAAQLSLVRQISEAFFEYAYLHKAVEITEENLLLLEELIPIVEEKVRVGGELSSLLRLKVEIGQAQDKSDSLTRGLAVTEIRLQQLLASDLPIPAPLWDKPAELNWSEEALLEKLRATNPELKVSELKIESAQAARELAGLQARPDLSLGINYIQIGEAISPNVNGSGVDPWGLTFSVSLPLNFKKNRAARAEADSRIQANEASRLDTLNKLNNQLGTSLIKYRDAQRRHDLYADELIPLGEQAWEISQTSYENGHTGILDVIDSERALLNLRLEYWRATADLWQQQIVIETLTNAESFNTL